MARVLVTLTFALALLAGCGGGDDDGGGGDGGAKTPSREEFVSEANKICREGATEIGKSTQDAQAKIRAAKTPKERQEVLADVLEATAKRYAPYLERLRDLEAPRELRAEWEKFVAGVDHAFDLIPELADATRDGDRQKLAQLTTEFTQIAADTRPFAQKYRLDDCLPENSRSG